MKRPRKIRKKKIIKKSNTNLIYFKLLKILIILLFGVFSMLKLKKHKIIEISDENNILAFYKKKLEDFCNNQDKYINNEIEKEIKLFDVEINGTSYQMYSTKIPIGLSSDLSSYKAYEKKETLNILEALKFYGNKMNIKDNKDIYMIDVGGSAGWYPSFLGRFKYTILTFEPFPVNYYIISKNYCLLNKNSNVIIINQGLNIEEKVCSYYTDRECLLNGMTLCDGDNNNRNIVMGRFFKKGEVNLTRLSNFIPYLSDKNIALIKLDCEGSEERAIKSGMELVTKYHVPFIFLEFSPKFLGQHNSDPSNFIKFFLDNGYVMSINGFLDKNYITLEELLNKVKFQINLYLIYQGFINN